MPDGAFVPAEGVPTLKGRKLIVANDEWPGDYSVAIDVEDDAAVTRLENALGTAYQHYGFPVGSRVEGYNHYTGQSVRGLVEDVSRSKIDNLAYCSVRDAQGQVVVMASYMIRLSN